MTYLYFSMSENLIIPFTQSPVTITMTWHPDPRASRISSPPDPLFSTCISSSRASLLLQIIFSPRSSRISSPRFISLHRDFSLLLREFALLLHEFSLLLRASPSNRCIIQIRNITTSLRNITTLLKNIKTLLRNINTSLE